jgi:hypothetical protein
VRIKKDVKRRMPRFSNQHCAGAKKLLPSVVVPGSASCVGSEVGDSVVNVAVPLSGSASVGVAGSASHVGSEVGDSVVNVAISSNACHRLCLRVLAMPGL